MSLEVLADELAELIENLDWAAGKLRDLIKSGDLDGRRAALDRLKIAERAVEDARDEIVLKS